jgi:hypothetical protein
MSLAAQLTAALVTGPQQVTDNPFPSGACTINFGLNPPQKQYVVTTGDQVVTVAAPTPNVYQAIDCIGTGGAVTQALTLFLRTQVPMMVQMTFNNPNGGTTVITEPINGVKLQEYPANGTLIALGVQGAGSIEVWAAGNQ